MNWNLGITKCSNRLTCVPRYYNWTTAGPLLLAMQAFQKPLPKVRLNLKVGHRKCCDILLFTQAGKRAVVLKNLLISNIYPCMTIHLPHTKD